MKKLFLPVLLAVPLFSLTAQEKSLNVMSLNGATGLYVVPTARIGFADASMGFNAGYHTNIYKPFGKGDTGINHLIQANFSFLKMFEVSGTFDVQPKDAMGKDPNDLLAGFKFQLPFVTIPVAVGSNFQYRNMGRENTDHWAVQIYGAVTYQADLLGWPAETTLVIGHTILEEKGSSNIDFGVGFDLVIFPKYLQSFLHLLIDYANFSYSADPWGANADYRGILNTGLRLDLAQIPALSKFNFAVDIYMADAFDDRDIGGRSFGVGTTFGLKF
ncbi:MAG: hypothetical protein LBD31_04205 [Treponema sp.]|jgi:hypothetical protein|nr:hypothetical protein [Treponema sp.]